MTPLERDIERAMVAKVKQHGGYCLKWVCPGWAGVPDRIILLPGGHIAFAELKRPKGGRLSSLQKWWGERLSAMGFDYWVLWSHEDVRQFERTALEGKTCD